MRASVSPSSPASERAVSMARCGCERATCRIASSYSSALGTATPVWVSVRRSSVLLVSLASMISCRAAMAASSVAPVASAISPRAFVGGLGKALATYSPARRPDLIWYLPCSPTRIDGAAAFVVSLSFFFFMPLKRSRLAALERVIGSPFVDRGFRLFVCRDLSRKPSRLAEGHEPSAFLVPERQPGAMQAFAKGQPPDVGENVMVAKDLAQAVEWNSAGQMVDMVNADIGRDPVQYRRQHVVRRAVESGLLNRPAVVAVPRRVLELMLHVEEPHADRGREQHHRQVDEDEDRPATQHVEGAEQCEDRRVGSERADPEAPARPHGAHGQPALQEEHVGRSDPEEHHGVPHQPVEDPPEKRSRAVLRNRER